MTILNNYLKKIWHDAAGQNNDILMSCVKPQKTAKILDIGIFRGELAKERFNHIENPSIYGPLNGSIGGC